jgi:colicin import membrane protein
MDAAADRPEFAPPPQRGNLRAFTLAIAAHLLLLVALTRGLDWQREVQTAAVEAELWSALPQEAAPPPPPPPPPPQPVVQAPPPPPVVRAPPEPQVNRDAQIAIEREREKRELERERKLEQERERKLEQERERKLAQERERKAEQEREREQRRKDLALQKKRDEELAKKKELQKQQQVADARRKEDEKKRRQAEQEARDAERMARQRDENLKRIQGMAGTGAPSSTGNAAQSSGPSASWGAKVQARVRPNIVFTDEVSGNPKAEVEVRTSPDGTIIGKRLVHSSGVKGWDEAVLRALDKTEALPRDTDGRVPSPVIIGFRPKG